ncbi:MAG: dihydropteroate synthase [Parvularculaceae bacterium]
MFPLRIMGVINVTPDSFSDGGRLQNAAEAIAYGLRLAEEGAGILDIGGESTRPGADMVPTGVELDRVIPVIKGLCARLSLPICVDTRKPEVARRAVTAGASIWNDVSALTFAADSLETAAALGCDIVLMHAQGDPKTMQIDPHYDEVVEEVVAFLARRIEACIAAGIARSRLIVDPGIGFGKTLAHNLALIANLDKLAALACPILVGASRKRFIAALDRNTPPEDRLGGSIAAVLAAHARGASIFRVHDVAATRQALAVAGAVKAAIEKASTLS